MTSESPRNMAGGFTGIPVAPGSPQLRDDHIGADESPDTSVVAMKASSCPNPTAAMGMAPSPPTRNTATMPSVRWRRLLTVTGRASVITKR